MTPNPDPVPRVGWFAAIAPGILIAATGVGAGDLLTASFAGSDAGLVILWAAWVGAILKWTLNEGIARWQMATGTTLLEGWIAHLGAWIKWAFGLYLLLWSFCVGGALMTACGVAGSGLWPIFGPDRLEDARVFWGVTHSLVGLGLVRAGGFRVFERMMSLCIGVMFTTVVVAAILLRPDWGAVGRGLVSFQGAGEHIGWIVGVLGGVGGTVTILSYGYWIRERDRRGHTGLRASRIDLALGYTMTALFGIAMIIIGSHVDISRGELAALQLADQLEVALGSTGRWIFLVGFWAAVFSSLLGVWQGVPYIFSDFVALSGWTHDNRVPFTQRRSYNAFLFGLAIVPLPLLWFDVKQVQMLYAIGGAMFMPMLALTLLIMNSREKWVTANFKNSRFFTIVLLATLAFFVWVGARAVNKIKGSTQTSALIDSDADLQIG